MESKIINKKMEHWKNVPFIINLVMNLFYFESLALGINIQILFCDYFFSNLKLKDSNKNSSNDDNCKSHLLQDEYFYVRQASDK